MSCPDHALPRMSLPTSGFGCFSCDFIYSIECDLFTKLDASRIYGLIRVRRRDLRNDRRVALKISDIDAADYKVDPSLRNANLESVMHEYTVLKQLEGAERVNQILDILDVHSQVWIASEYCPGGSVHTLVR